jgi:alanyl-tRNA synthetase
VEKVRTGWRVEFVCGLRAVRSARRDFQTLAEVGQQLSVGLAEVPEAIRRLQSERKQSAKQIEVHLSELARYRAAELVRQLPIENGLRLVRLHLTPAEAEGPAYAKLLASMLTAQSEKTVAIFAWRPAEEATTATIILARSSNLDLDCDATLRKALSAHNGRGGGSKEMAQGSIPQEHLLSVMETLAAAAESLRHR